MRSQTITNEKQMISGAETTFLFGVLWKEFGRHLLKACTKAVKNKWKVFEYEGAARKYAENMRRQYGFIKILGLTSPVPLDDIFIRLNVLSTPSALQRVAKKDLEAIFLGTSTYGDIIEHGKSAVSALREHDKLYVIGKPGAGKTTFLKYITIRAVSNDMNLVPIFISLRTFSESKKSLLDFIEKQFRICQFPDAGLFIQTVLEQGKAILLCDGLDEVNKENKKRDRVIQQLTDFSNEYAKNRFVLTCRVAASDYSFEQFTTVELADFDKAQISSFVRHWFSSDTATGKLFLADFEKKGGNESLQDLARIPLLLALLCLQFDRRFQFPPRRSEIYEEALDALLFKWDAERRQKRDPIHESFSHARQCQMFSRIAAPAFENREFLMQRKRLEGRIAEYLQNLPPSKPHESIDGAAALKDIEAYYGIFSERAKGLYSFSHLTFQEYFTARYVCTNARKGSLDRLVRSHWKEDRWREVFLLTAEMLDDAEDFFECFLVSLAEFAGQDAVLSNLLAKVNDATGQVPVAKRTVQMRSAFAALYIQAIIKCNLFAGNGDDAINPSTLRARASAKGMAGTPTLSIAENVPCDINLDLALFDASRVFFTRAGPTAAQRSTAVQIAFRICEKLSERELSRELEALPTLEGGAPGKNGEGFAKRVSRIVDDHRDMKCYKLSVVQSKTLWMYFYGVQLLVDSLQNAYVTDRAALENRVLLPPQ